MTREMDAEVYGRRGLSWVATLRIATAIVLMVVLIGITAWTRSALSDARTNLGQDPSAIQVSQVYVEGAFWAVTAIGIGIAIYIGTRSYGD